MAGKTWKVPPLVKLPPAPSPPRLDWTSKGVMVDADVISTDATVVMSATSAGLRDLEERLLLMPQIARDAAGRQMSIIQRRVVIKAQKVYVPYEFGGLQESGDSDEYVPGSGAGITKIASWFGGLSTREEALHGRRDEPHRYALEQHENPTYHHPNRGIVENPQYKYLQRAFNEEAKDAPAEIGMAVEQAWGGVGKAPEPPTEVPDANNIDIIFERLKKAPAYPKYGKKGKKGK